MISEVRWLFVRTIYSLVATQLLVTIVVAAIIVSHDPIVTFLTTTRGGFTYFLLLLTTTRVFTTPFIRFFLMFPLYHYRHRHPVNYVCLGILSTVSMAFAVGFACAMTSRKAILEATILTAVVVVSVSLFTFRAAKRGYDFKFLGPFLFGYLMVILVFGLIQTFFPPGRIVVMMHRWLVAKIFCGYIVYDTDTLIKRYTYDDFIWAAVALYLDVINLFMGLLACCLHCCCYDQNPYDGTYIDANWSHMECILNWASIRVFHSSLSYLNYNSIYN
ncbi:protein LIFEGUARD 2-like [Bidens hawaiensis]|uniref:protein LIFEGUARD 2-like n=1 Tax=Bidens hawaiensis TaxID=980011 RepID=UPI00404B40D5